jgi:hypothetical protein
MAGLWMRVDGFGDTTLSFDNMENRPITGTTDWTHYTVVLDVPQESTIIAFGLWLAGSGQAWIADAQIVSVGLDVTTTDVERMLSQPVNLDFSE